MTDEIQHSFEDLTAPFFILHGQDDPLHDPEISESLYRRGKSLDKSLRKYANMQHSMLGGQSNANVQKIYEEIIEWLHERTAVAADGEEEDDDEEEAYLEDEGRH